jgi:hypothetical protein
MWPLPRHTGRMNLYMRIVDESESEERLEKGVCQRSDVDTAVSIMNFYCSEKHDKNKSVRLCLGRKNITRAKPQNNTKHGEGHTDHEEAQAGDQAAAVKDQLE